MKKRENFTDTNLHHSVNSKPKLGVLILHFKGVPSYYSHSENEGSS